MQLSRLTILVSAFSTLACCLHGSTSRAACQDSWSPEPPLNEARHFLGACTAPCGDIYAIGGGAGMTRVATVERLAYDGENYAASWETLPDMPTARTQPSVVCTNGFIYVIGGNDGAASDSVDRYDLWTETWSAIEPLNLGRSNAGATIDPYGRIWVIGGNVGGYTTTVEIYDPARPSDGWVFGPDLVTPRGYAGAFTDSLGRIWAIGGSTTGPSHTSSIERIDSCGGGWEVLGLEVPGGVSQTDYSVLGEDQKAYIVGGWMPGGSNRVLQLDSVTERWLECTPISQSVNGPALTLGANGRIFRIAGHTGSSTSQSMVESLDTRSPPVGAVPAVSDWGVAIMALLVLGAATVSFRRLRTTAIA